MSPRLAPHRTLVKGSLVVIPSCFLSSCHEDGRWPGLLVGPWEVSLVGFGLTAPLISTPRVRRWDAIVVTTLLGALWSQPRGSGAARQQLSLWSGFHLLPGVLNQPGLLATEVSGPINGNGGGTRGGEALSPSSSCGLRESTPTVWWPSRSGG